MYNKKKIFSRGKTMSNLQKLRESRQLNQYELSVIAGISFRTLQHYEQGQRDIKSARAITVYKLAQALQCTMEELMEVENLT